MKNEKWARKKATTTSTAAAGCSASCLDGFTLQQVKSKRAGAKSVRHTLDIIRSGFQCILFYYRNAFTKYILILSMFSFFFSAVVVAPSFVCVCFFGSCVWFGCSFFQELKRGIFFRCVSFELWNWQNKRTHTKRQQKKECKPHSFCSFLPLPFECARISVSFVRQRWHIQAHIAYSLFAFSYLKKVASTHRPIW